MRFLLVVGLLSGGLIAENYTGPKPPKPDIPYLLHADKLTETEVTEAREESHKGESTYAIQGASSPARTPLAEPIFIFESKNINPEQMEAYRLEVKNGHREATVTQKRRRGG